MYLHGHYYNELNQLIEVHIVTRGDRTTDIEIGNEADGVFFTDDPVEITSSVSETLDVLHCRQAAVRLLTRNFIEELFCASCFEAVVNILRDGACVFAGYIEPQTYSQDYNEELDELELSCIDALSALEYGKYRGIGAGGVTYEIVKAGAVQLSFLDIIRMTLGSVTEGLSLTEGREARYWYDTYKSLPEMPEGTTIFEHIGINELLFMGSEEDDVWGQDEVMTEVLKYLNLHIVQYGMDFYLFDWFAVKGGERIHWREILTGEAMMTLPVAHNIRTEMVADTDTNISINEVFNKIVLTCSVEDIEDLIESPLDSDLLTSPYSNKQLYMKEYSSHGEGIRAEKGFLAMIRGGDYVWEEASMTEWYIQVRQNAQWIFPDKGSGSLMDQYCAKGQNQQDLPNALRRQIGAALVSLGSVERKQEVKDNAPVSKIDMKDYLVISVNGNGQDGENTAMPNEAAIKASIPVAIYHGNTSGGVFSPADEGSTNYIVISGEVVLNPLMELSGEYRTILRGEEFFLLKTVPSRKNKDGRFYTQQWFRAETPRDTAVWDEGVSGLVPFTETGPEQYEFQYSAVGEGEDRVSKVAVLACMLIIGDKCVVETGTQGQPADFSWQPYKRREECASDDEYYAQSFTIGFDPKIGDKLIGTKFDLQNNIDYTMGIDAEGIAIPIRRSDRVSGAVKFVILGPVNTLWDVVTRRHSTFFRHTKWGKTTIPLLAHVGNILVEKFEIKVYSDNGLISNSGDSDILYMSDTDERFVNVKDDLGMKINSALTAEECRTLGVTNTVKMSNPVNLMTQEPILRIIDATTNAEEKPEQLYVDAVYREYHQPRVTLEQTFMHQKGIVNWTARYHHPAMKGREFYVVGINENLTAGTATVTLKENDITEW